MTAPNHAPPHVSPLPPALQHPLRAHARAHLRYTDRPLTTAGTPRLIACLRPPPGWATRLSGVLDRLAVPYLRFGTTRHSSYNVMGYAGTALGTIAAAAVGRASGLPAGVLAAVWITVVVASLGQIVVTAWTTGRDRLVFLRYLIGGALATAGVLAVLDRPFLPYLDVLVVGFGVVQATGRIGCHMAGCCHGRLAGWGVAYDARHRASALPPALYRARLLPAQLSESLWIAGCTGVATVLILADAAPGAAAGAYLSLYATGRFAVEAIRGDLYRVHRWGLSEARWIALAIAATTGAAAAAGGLPVPAWAFLFLAVPPAGALYRLARRSPAGTAAAPEDVLAIARALNVLREGGTLPVRNPDAVHVARTDAGLLLSGDPAPHDGGHIPHLTLSSVNEPLTDRRARQLATILSRLIPRTGRTMLYKAADNLYHTVCHPHTAPAHRPGISTATIEERDSYES